MTHMLSLLLRMACSEPITNADIQDVLKQLCKVRSGYDNFTMDTISSANVATSITVKSMLKCIHECCGTGYRSLGRMPLHCGYTTRTTAQV